MTWQFTSEVLIASLAAAVALILGFASWRWWKTPGIIYYALIMISIGGWALFSGLEIASVPIPVKIMWAKMQYIEIAFIAAFWLLLSMQYTHQDHRISTWWVILLMLIPALTVYIVITEDKHRWLWDSIVPLSNIPGEALKFTPGWWSSVSSVFFYSQIIIGVVILIRRILLPPRSVGARALLLLIGVLPPLLCNLIYQLQLISGINFQIFLMVGLVISGMIYFWGIYYFQLLEYASLSRDVIIDNMSEGVIVLDRKDRIFNINTTALSMLGLNQHSAKRKTLNDIIAIWPGISNTFRVAHDFETEVRINGDSPKTLSIRTTNLKDRDGRPTGRMVVWRDVTQYRQVESTLENQKHDLRRYFKVHLMLLSLQIKTATLSLQIIRR